MKPVEEAGDAAPTRPAAELVAAEAPAHPKAPALADHPWIKKRSFFRTSSERKNSEIRDSTYNKENELIGVKVIYLDSLGRHRQGVTYDARNQPTGSILFDYDPKSGEVSAERHFDKAGKLVRTVPRTELITVRLRIRGVQLRCQ